MYKFVDKKKNPKKPQRCSMEKVVWKYAASAQENCVISIKVVFHKVAFQLYWNQPSPSMFFCKFAAYFQNTF